MTAKTKSVLTALVVLLLLGAGMVYAVSELGTPSDDGEPVLVRVPADASGQEGTGEDTAKDPVRNSPRAADRVSLEIGIEGEIEGRILDPLSDPVSGARITLRRSMDVEEQGTKAPVVATARSDERGTFRMSGLELGTYAIRALADGLGDGQRTVFLRRERPRHVGLILRLHQCKSVVGVVVDSMGEPVADAWIVGQWSFLRGGGVGGMGSPEVRSGKDGRFTFPAVPMGALARFVAWSEGRMLGMADMVVGQSEPPRIVLPDVGPYEMVFSLADSSTKEGKRPSDMSVLVKVLASDELVPLPSPIRTLAIPADGSIRLQGLCEGTYHFIQSSKEVAVEESRAWWRLTEDKPVATVKLAWSVLRGVEGRLVYKDGKPAQGIRLAVGRRWTHEPLSAVSDQQGNFKFPRQFSADAEKMVYFGVRGFVFEKGDSRSFFVLMQPGVKGRVLTVLRTPVLSGRVVDENGKPVLAAVVSLRAPGDSPQDFGAALTNGKGEFRLSPTKDVEGSLLLDVTHDSMHCPEPLAMEAKALKTREGIVLRMVGAASVGGRIVDLHGNGIAGVMVTVNLIPRGEGQSGLALTRLKSRARWLGVQRHAFSNREGRFRVLGLEPGRWVVSVETLGREKPKTEPIVSLAPGEKQEGLRIILSEGLSIEGRIVTDSGVPVGGAQIISFFSGELPRGSVRTTQPIQADSDGAFVLKGLHSGEYGLTVRPPDEWMSKMGLDRKGPDGGVAMSPSSFFGGRVAAGTKGYRWEIAVPRFSEVRARLVHNGVPLQHIQVEIRSDADKWSFDMPVRQGAVSMKHVLTGSYDLTFKSPRFADLELRVEVREGQVTDLGTLQLADVEEVEGRVSDQYGNPLAGVWIGLDEKLSKLWQHYEVDRGMERFAGRVLTQSDARGRFRVPIKGRIRIHAFKPGYGPVAQSYATEENQKAARQEELVLTLSGAGEITIQPPAAPKGMPASWSARLRRIADTPTSKGKLGTPTDGSQVVEIDRGRPVRVIGLRPGTYRLEAVENSMGRGFQKKSIPGESYYVEVQVQVGTKRLIKIP